MTRRVTIKAAAFYAGITAIFIVMSALCGCMMRHAAAPEYFAREEKRLTTLIDDTTDPNTLSDLYVLRARLRVRSDNPAPDYHGALKDFSASIDLNSRRWDSGDIRDWIAALSRMARLEQDLSRSNAGYEQSEQRNRALTRRVDQLEKQESGLRKSIEELQSLELQMEQRRQQLR